MTVTNSVAIQGQGTVPATLLNAYVQSVATAAALRDFVGQDGMRVVLGGISTFNDGYGGIFYWSQSATASDDNMNVIVPTATASGAWVRGNIQSSGDTASTLITTSTSIVLSKATTSYENNIVVDASSNPVEILAPLNIVDSGKAKKLIIFRSDTSGNLVTVAATTGVPIATIMGSGENGNGLYCVVTQSAIYPLGFMP